MIDITGIVKEAGLNLRTFLTPAAWGIFNEGGLIQGRDLQKRLSMMIDILQIALTQRKGAKERIIYFSARLRGRGDTTSRLLFKAAVENQPCGPSAITLMLPGEEGGEEVSEEEKVRVEKLQDASIRDGYGQGTKMRSKRSILIVDDEVGVRESLRMILKPYYDIHTAADGQEALNIFRGKKIHLITLDLYMPRLSGIETLREIRKMDSEVPIIIITGYGTEQHQKEAFLNGVRTFIFKPFDTDKIIPVIHGLLEE